MLASHIHRHSCWKSQHLPAYVFMLFHIAEYEEEWSWLWKLNTGHRVSKFVTVQVYWTQASKPLRFWGHFRAPETNCKYHTIIIQQYKCHTLFFAPISLTSWSKLFYNGFLFLCTQNNYFIQMLSTLLLKSHKISHPTDRCGKSRCWLNRIEVTSSISNFTSNAGRPA